MPFFALVRADVTGESPVTQSCRSSGRMSTLMDPPACTPPFGSEMEHLATSQGWLPVCQIGTVKV